MRDCADQQRDDIVLVRNAEYRYKRDRVERRRGNVEVCIGGR